MKTLPDNPNLDHLRRQAKDLLAGLRDSHPDASLADAQASLAEQYGFRTWTDRAGSGAQQFRRRGRGDRRQPVAGVRVVEFRAAAGRSGQRDHHPRGR
jgi:hypothetical protein